MCTSRCEVRRQKPLLFLLLCLRLLFAMYVRVRPHVCCAYVAWHTVSFTIRYCMQSMKGCTATAVAEAIITEKMKRNPYGYVCNTNIRLYYNAIDVTLVSCTDGSISFHIIFIWYVTSIKLLSPRCRIVHCTECIRKLQKHTLMVNALRTAMVSAWIVVIWHCGVW